MEQEKRGLNISVRSFITAIIMLLALMVITYLLTFWIPGGSYQRIIQDGQELVVAGTYAPAEGGIAFWKWICSPLLVLTAEGNGTILAIIAFLLIIGGTFHCLDKSGLMAYMLQKIAARFREKKYTLLCCIALFFMALGAFVGSFEECVPLVPLAVALSVSLGWDALTGLGMSLLAVGCGFSSGVCNPFTVGIAQELAGLSMFSGIAFRLLTFAVIYVVLIVFLTRYAKKIEKKGSATELQPVIFTKDKRMEHGLRAFSITLGCGVLLIIGSPLLPFLQGIIMPVIALVFLIAGLLSSTLCGMKGKRMAGFFKDGAVSILPAVLLILMASSIKYTLTEANVLDTILYKATAVMQGLPQGAAILFLYLIVLAMNFFISSGSAKAFLLMPLLTPMADLCGISRQLTVLAFAFGDGFSNVFYMTNPVLLISLGLAGIGYGKWARWSWKFQFVILLITSGILLLASAVGYA